MSIDGQTVRWSMGGLILVGIVPCDTETLGPTPAEFTGPIVFPPRDEGGSLAILLCADRRKEAPVYPEPALLRIPRSDLMVL
jgi:hypothetical protein